jgi:hypothetical protein
LTLSAFELFFSSECRSKRTCAGYPERSIQPLLQGGATVQEKQKQMRVRNKELRQRRHRKEQRIKEDLRAIRAGQGDKKPAAAKKPAAPKPAAKKTAGEKKSPRAKKTDAAE